MDCPKCHFDNPTDSHFCNKCGTQIGATKEALSPETKTIQIVTIELTPGSIFAKRYQVIEELGKGGMGRVYKVLDKELGEKVALKLLHPEIAAESKTIERFRNELKTARQISHKNVCRMYHFSKEEETYYITMEYVRGEDLKSMLRMMGRLSPGQVIPIARQVCEGLAEAHKLGVVHRDLKPHNLMIDCNGNVKIMDFGIARSLRTKGITGAGVMIGTPEYMSPEQVEGRETDARSDIYALGIILYDMLTGRLPFEGETVLGVALKQKTETPIDPRKINPQVPEDLARLIMRCLEKEKENRFQTAEELITEFNRIEKGIPSAERIMPKGKPLTSKEITIKFKKRWRAIAAVALIAVAGAAAVLYFGRGKPVPEPATNRIVVLPFENLGAPEDEYFADGMTDEIIARLTGVREMSVIARNSAMQYRKTKKTVKQISEELGTDYILSGTIRWQKSTEGSGQVRVTPMLVRASDSTQLWANIYDRPIAEVFGVQSDISKEVVAALGVALLKPEKRSIETKPTENMEAYDFYLRGMAYFYGGRAYERDNRLAIEMLEKCVGLDPGFLQAHAQLARVRANYYWLHFDRSETWVARVKDAVDRAVQISADAPETNTALGYYHYHINLDYETALKHFLLAKDKQPRNPVIIEGIGYVKRRQGKLNEAANYLEQAAKLDPVSPEIHMNLGQTLALLGNYEDAKRSYDRVVFLNPHYFEGYEFKARLYLYKEGNIQGARRVLGEAAQSLGSLKPNNITYLWVLTDVFDGEYQQALERLASVSEDAFSDQFHFVPKTLLSAQIHKLMNEPELEKSEYESARKSLEQKIAEDPTDSRYWSTLGIALAGLRQKREAMQTAEKAVEILPISRDSWRGAKRAEDLARVYTMAGEYDNAFDILENLLSMQSEMSVPLLKIDPAWAPLRSLPRFQKLLQEY